VDRLADDHATRSAWPRAWRHRRPDGASAQTNIVFVDVADGRGPALLAHLKRHGVLATGLIGLRFVTHLDVDAAGIDRAMPPCAASSPARAPPAAGRRPAVY
jgi:threonine aldolase